MHVSDFKKFNKCLKLYEYSLSQTEKPSYVSFYNINVDVNELVAKKLNITQYLTGQPNQTNEDTFQMAKNCEWIFKARFEYRGLRVRIPLIRIVGNECEVYSILLSTNINSDEYTNLFYYLKVLQNANLEVKSLNIIYLNKNYIRDNELDVQQLFLSSSMKDDNTTIKQYVKTLDINLDQMIDDINNYQGNAEIVRTSKCTGRNKCSHYDECFPDEINLPDNSILTLVSSQHKYEMYNEGLKYLKDADLNRVEGNRLQYAQIKADQNGGLFIDKEVLKLWLNDNIQYPISFIDFEWDLYPIPPFKGMKPLDVLLFQYSLHVYDGEKLQHYQFIGINDDRRQLAESMLDNMPATGSILAYNAKGAEKIRINELANLFPDLQERLQALNKRMVDLADPFVNGVIYDTRFKGNFSLKMLEEICDNQHSYHDLDCTNGMEAVVIHRKLEQTDDETLEQVYYDQLYKYCGLDTYSLYKVLNWLIEKVG